MNGAGTLARYFAVLLLLVVSGRGAADLPDFTELVEQNHESVVNISTAKTGGDDQSSGATPDFEDSPFEEFFRRFLEEQKGPDAQEQQFDSDSLGSGFIISDDGFILTNNHVVDGADEIIVRLHDRRQYVAELIGKDARSDVAVLKIDATGLPAARIGKSSSLKVGEWVLAIGSPFGFDFSVTAGIVSAKGRSLPRENYVPFIQTDVAINPGNSGGPLFNLAGEVVGINSQIYSRTGGFMGLSFSIPIEMAMDIAEQLKETGSVSRGWLGVIIQEVTRELAESFSMRTAHGALISRILKDSPAAGSDLQVGDIIVEFNGSRVEKSSSLPPLVGQVRAGGTASVNVIRNGEMVTLDVVIGELPGAEELQKNRRAPTSRVSNKLGVEVGPISDEMRAQIESGGVVVNAVANGPGKVAGIRVGDILTMIDNTLVNTIEDFEKAMDSVESGSSIAVLVQREQGPIFIALTIE